MPRKKRCIKTAMPGVNRSQNVATEAQCRTLNANRGAWKAPSLGHPAPAPPQRRENTQMAISTCGTGTQDIASRPVWRKTNSRREPRRDVSTEPQSRAYAEKKTLQQKRNAGRKPRAKRCDRSAMPHTERKPRHVENALIRPSSPRAPQRRENTRMAISTGGTGTQGIASRPVWRKTNSRRERRQNAAAETQSRAYAEKKTLQQKRNAMRKPKSKRCDRSAMPHTERKPRRVESAHVTPSSPRPPAAPRERTNGDLDLRNRNARHRKPSLFS